MNFARILRESGLTKVELAQIYDVSRQTIHAWCQTAPRAGSLMARHAAAIDTALLEAINKHLLPFAAMEKDARRARIARMATRLQGLKPAPK